MGIKPYYDTNGITIYCGDCLEIMPQLDVMVDCVIADPPYYKIVREDWDRQWRQLKDYVDWLEKIVIDLKSLLISKGSMYIFGDDKRIAYVQVMADKHLTLLNSLVWYKTNNQSIKAAQNLRSYAPMTERILFYTPQLCPTGLETVKLDINNFQPLRQYFREYQQAIGLGLKQINDVLGHRKAEHAFYWDTSQWDLPTKETYEQLRRTFNTNGFIRREYEDLRREYEDLRRTFNATNETLDVITGPIVSDKDNTPHPTTKPVWLMSHLIRTSTNQGDVLIDPFIGSGTTLVAARAEGRRAIGIDIDEHWCKVAVERLKHEKTYSLPNGEKFKQVSFLPDGN